MKLIQFIFGYLVKGLMCIILNKGALRGVCLRNSVEILHSSCISDVTWWQDREHIFTFCEKVCFEFCYLYINFHGSLNSNFRHFSWLPKIGRNPTWFILFQLLLFYYACAYDRAFSQTEFKPMFKKVICFPKKSFKKKHNNYVYKIS